MRNTPYSFTYPKPAILKKILVIDDDADILDLVKYVLLKAGFDVYTHDTGIGVNEKVTACKPNAILLDIMLPGKTGTEVYKELRKTHTTPIIFFSAHADKQKILKECAADAFIQKPFDINQLVHTISKCLN